MKHVKRADWGKKGKQSTHELEALPERLRQGFQSAVNLL